VNGGGGSSGEGRRTYGPLWRLLGSLVGLTFGLFFSFFFSFSFYLFLSLAQLIILKKVKEVVGKTRAATG
jgi:hypothetical protein